MFYLAFHAVHTYPNSCEKWSEALKGLSSFHGLHA